MYVFTILELIIAIPLYIYTRFHFIIIIFWKISYDIVLIKNLPKAQTNI